MKIGSAFPSKYLKADDIGDSDRILTIDRVVEEEIGNDVKEMKAIVYFKEEDKGLVLNKTNADTIVSLTGSDETDEWEGHRIALFTTEVSFQGKTSLGIRVRLRKPAAAPAKPASTAGDDLAKVKAEAWKVLVKKYPTETKERLIEILKGHVSEFFEGQTPATLGIAQYRQLIEADFDHDRLAMIGGGDEEPAPF